jgi:4-amino-4-deoxy-L-arabinose transferase-like glycosyltransferase
LRKKATASSSRGRQLAASLGFLIGKKPLNPLSQKMARPPQLETADKRMHRHVIEDSSRHVFGLTVLCLLLYFPYLGARDFWDIETHFAEVIRVMVLDGNYLLPTMNGQLWTENPPLYFWIAVVFAWLFGEVNEWTIRLPSALSATELVLVYYIFLRKRFGAQLAFLSTIVLATSVLTVHVERHVPINMTFYLFVILALFLIMEVVVFDSVRLRDAYSAWFFVALACLTNGVIGMVIPAVVVFPYLMISRRWRHGLALRPFTGSLLFLAVIGTWAACVAWKTPETWWEVIFAQLRLLHYSDHSSADHQFFFRFPLAFTPWAFLLVPALVSLWPSRFKLWDKAVLFMFVWFLSAWALSETLVGYHSHYVFLTCFSVALVLGAYLDQLMAAAPGASVRVWTHRFVLVIVFILVLGGITAPPIVTSRSPVLMMPTLALAIAALVFSICFYSASKRSNDVALICGFAMLPIIVNFLLQGLLFPSLNPMHGRRFAEKIGALANGQAGVRLALASNTRINFFNYYAGIKRFETLNGREDVVKFLSGPRPTYILVRQGGLKQLKEVWQGDLSLVLTGTTVRGDWLVLSPCTHNCNPIPLSAGR